MRGIPVAFRRELDRDAARRARRLDRRRWAWLQWMTTGVLSLVVGGLGAQTNLAQLDTVRYTRPVVGTITELRPDAGSTWTWLGGTRRQRWMQAHFAYELDGVRYATGRLRPGGVWVSRGNYLIERDAYRVGTRVNAWADPTNPARAVVMRSDGRPGWLFWNLGLAGIGAICAGVGLLKRRWRPSAAEVEAAELSIERWRAVPIEEAIRPRSFWSTLREDWYRWWHRLPRRRD